MAALVCLGCTRPPAPEADAPRDPVVREHAHEPAHAAAPGKDRSADPAQLGTAGRETISDEPGCAARRARIEATIDALPRPCQEDADCTVVGFACPFPCTVYLPGDATLSDLRARIREYEDACGRCKRKCAQGRPAACVAGRCAPAPRPG